MKTYLELEGNLGTQPQQQSCTSTYSPDKNYLPWKTPVLKKAEKKKRAKAPVKRMFKVRVIVHSLTMNPNLSANPTPTAVTITTTSSQMPVTKPATATSKSILIPVTAYNLAQAKFKVIPYPIRKSQEEEDPSTPSGNNAPKVQQSEAIITAAALWTREDTPWPNTIPVSTNLFVERALWPIPPYNDEVPTPTFVTTEKAEDRTPPKLAAIPYTMPPQNKSEEMCRWGLHCPIQIPRQQVQKIGMAKDRTSCKETRLPKAHSVLHHVTFLTGSLSTIKQKKTGRRDWNFK